jgi:drug/metabolite transporter (DMT)-like permease
VALARRRRGLLTQPRPVLVAGLGGGVVSLAAYGLVLLAQTSGATAAVAALRETGIVVGAVIGTVFLGERFGIRRAAAAAVVAVGIVLVDV